jgi:hypothetical protein
VARINIAVLVVLCLAIDIQAARPADLSLRPKHSHKRAIDGQQRKMAPAEKELLFQQYQEWLQNRTDLQQDIPLRLVLRPSVAP